MSDAPATGARAPLVPALGWIARYQRDWLGPDVLAGLTAAAVVIPKAMAFATIAGLPLQAGLYTAFVPLLVYAVLGSSANLSVSTTTTIAILAAAQLGPLAQARPEVSLLAANATLAVLVGAMLLAARVLRLGFLANFISEPVLTGFKSGIGLVIVVDQLPKLLGIHIDKSGFFRDIAAIAHHLPECSLPTLLVALCGFAVIGLLHRYRPRLPAPLLVVGLSILGSVWLELGAAGVAVVGNIPGGLPGLTLPDRALALELWPAAAGIALMSFTESIAAGRAFLQRGSARIDSDQELVGVGAASLVGGFFGALPCGGGTSQTAVNAVAGARTQLAGTVTALAALATMLFLAPALAALPQATLAAVVIAYSVGLISPAELAAIRRVRTQEFRWALAALLGVIVLGTLKGILIAIIVSMLSLMSQANNPPVYALHRRRGSGEFVPAGGGDDEALPGLLVVRVEGRVYFGNVQNIGDKLRALVAAAQPRVLLIDCRSILDFEYTALKALVESEATLRAQGIALWLAALNPEALAQVRRSSLAATLGPERLFPHLATAVEHWQRHAEAGPAPS